VRQFYQPERGDFITLNFTPQAGSEQAGTRPALVVSPKEFNIATGLAFVCPVTNQIKGGGFEVRIPKGAGVTGVVLSDNLRSVDWIARSANYLGESSKDLLMEVLARIEAVLAME
jgi:mRNA interferase MazF